MYAVYVCYNVWCMKPQADRIRAAGALRVAEARRLGSEYLTIVAGDLVRELSLDNRTPSVCSALSSKSFQQENQVELERREGPLQSTTTRFTYRVIGAPRGPSKFNGLRGIGKETFQKLGGGEAFLASEREGFQNT